ncbi:Capsule assembly protein Wzi [Cyclobacterium lianum]|uniref:Capsule assembly protein Wzi n=1 Tax=Cyclobacterium lianum TaxID=388280 RepID=A0A1M7QR75_9BACT|nr:capsule assembly Wzi family protein [Cyclobacterium lianum]SHN34098.1 Capsule assembly protein Wzi [Cyclobacterium lianum]
MYRQTCKIKNIDFPVRGKLLVGIVLFFLGSGVLSGQSLPANFPLVQDYLRRQQISGEFPTAYSFQLLPLKAEHIHRITNPQDSSTGLRITKPLLREDKSFQLQLMPIQLNQTNNTSHPYGWGDGPVLPAKGFQHLIELGFQANWGPLSLQLYPQFFHAQNLPFEEYDPFLPELFFFRISNFVGRLDMPVRHGRQSIKRMLPGNSHLKINFGAFSAGVSTESLWWGPGIQNALLISDNAEAFPHATIHTHKPAETAIGHFEGQYFIGKLENSNLPYYSDSSFEAYRNFPTDWRYFTGIALIYSPKWLDGLSLGIGRTFMMYSRKLEEDGFAAWFPIFEGLQKERVGLNTSRFRESDQHLSAFGRWVLPKAKTEIYAEFMRTDHALNWRELMLNPEHARGFTLGLSKIIPIAGQKQVYLNLEMSQTESSINNLVKYEGDTYNLNHGGLGLYENFQVVHGLTNRGQVLGSGLGHSGNSARITISRVNGVNTWGGSLERISRENNFYNFNMANGLDLLPWVDLSIAAHWEKHVGDFLISTRTRLIRSHNYNFGIRHSNSLRDYGEQRLNFHSRIKMVYLF